MKNILRDNVRIGSIGAICGSAVELEFFSRRSVGFFDLGIAAQVEGNAVKVFLIGGNVGFFFFLRSSCRPASCIAVRF